MKVSRSIGLVAIVSICTLAVCQEAVVTIYATTRGGTSQGTGFLTTDHGQVVTAYHVVQGATKISVSNEEIGTSADLRVDFVSPIYDIAVLQLLHSGPTPYFKLTDSTPSTAHNLEVQGYPLGDPKMSIAARATRNDFIQSNQMSDRRGKPLFGMNIDIIPLNMTIYPGMSGGPVLDGGRVMGILSGSYQEGGSIAWAIPCKYVAQLQEIGKKPDEIQAWEPLKLMNPSSWSSLRGMVGRNSRAAEIYDRYVNEVDDIAATYDEMHQQAQATRQAILIFRPFLERVISDPSLANNPEAAEQYIANHSDETFASLHKLGNLLDAAGSKGRDLTVVLMNLATWVTDEGNVSDKSGRGLVKRVRALRDQHQDMIHGIDKYLNIDVTQLHGSISELELASSRATNPAGKAQAMLRFYDAWLPAV
jgi:S1-C subfamily serine protease